jgi:O-antigen ligase
VSDLPARRPGGTARLLLLIASIAGFLGVFAIGFPPASRSRLPILVVALALALLSAWKRERGLVVFGFLFPLAGLGDRLFGGVDAIAWTVLLFSGLAAGWTFRFLYDFEGVPDPSRADRTLRALLTVWSLAAALAVVQARTLWALLRGLALRAVNVDGLPDAAAIRGSVLSYAVLAAGAAFFFLLRRAGPAQRERTLLAALAGVAVSAAAAVAERWGVGPGETSGYWKALGRLSGGAMDPNALGILCGLGAVVAADLAVVAEGRRRVFAALCLALMAAGLVLSGSRSGVALAGMGIFALLLARGLRARGRAAALMFGAVLVLGIALLRLSDYRGSAGARLAEIFDGTLPVEYRASARPVLWASAARLFERHPIEGAGLGAFFWQLPNLLAEEGRSLGLRDNPGNAYLQALAETGAIGLLLTAAFAFVLAREGWAALRDPGAPALRAGGGAAVIAFLAVLLTGSHWFAPDAAFLFFLLAAVTARPRIADRSRWSGRARALLVAAYAAAAFWSALGTLGPEEAFRYRARIGFHEREIGQGGPFFWTRRRFAICLEPGQTGRILLAHFTPEGSKVELTVEADGPTAFTRALEPGEAAPLRLFAGPAGPRVFRFTLSRAFVPRRLGVSGDRRELGVVAVFPPGG